MFNIHQNHSLDLENDTFRILSEIVAQPGIFEGYLQKSI